MSLNLGSGVQAASELRNNEHWQEFVRSVKAVAEQNMNTAIGVSVEQRADATAYARALRDFYIAIESATAGKHQNQVVKPGMENRSAVR